MILHAGQQRRHGHKEQIFGWRSGRRRGWYDLREQQGNIHITICKTDSQWELIYDTGSPKPVLCDHLEGWGEGKGSSAQEGRLTGMPMTDSR